MDNLTHSLVGYAAAKAGLEKTSPYATPLCIVAANLPDCDWAALFGGRWNYLQHHRGITHSIFGVALLIFILPTLFWLGDFLAARIKRRPVRVNWKGLLLASAIVLPTHPFLDWTNNYGWRPWLPFDGHWIYGDIAFVLDPLIWLTLGGAAFLIAAKSRKSLVVWVILISLVTAVIIFAPVPRAAQIPTGLRVFWLCAVAVLMVMKKYAFAAEREQTLARAALAIVAVYLCGMSLIQARALRQAESVARDLAAKENQSILKMATMPNLGNPARWTSLAETATGTYRFDVFLPDDVAGTAESVVLFPKPQGEAARAVDEVVQMDERAKIWSGFARFPGATVEGNCLTGIIVRLSDLRFIEPQKVEDNSGTFGLKVPADCPPTQ